MFHFYTIDEYSANSSFRTQEDRYLSNAIPSYASYILPNKWYEGNYARREIITEHSESYDEIGACSKRTSDSTYSCSRQSSGPRIIRIHGHAGDINTRHYWDD